MLKCGFYEVDITPDLGSGTPGYFEDRRSERILDKLYAHAFAAQSAGEPVIILSLDAIAIDKEDADAVREGISRMTGVPSANISIAATHTHTGGPVIDLYDSMKDAGYCNFLRGRAVNAGVMAFGSMEEAKIGVSACDVEGVAFNRRYRMKDGTHMMNPGFMNPETDCPVDIADPQLLVIRVDHADGTPMGMIADFALHLDTVGGDGVGCYSADYPGVIRRRMHELYGENFGFVFLTGTCGNVNHLDFSKPASEIRSYLTIGEILADVAKGLFEEIRTADTDKVCCIRSFFTGHMRRPTLKECEAMSVNPYIQREMIRAVILPVNDVEVEVWTSVIGDSVIQMLPGEVFTYFGVEVKKRSEGKCTLTAELCNTSIGYIYTKEAEKQGGYEATPSSYIIMDSDTGYRIVEAAADNLQKLK